MEQNVFEGAYREIFPFWNAISESDRAFICKNSFALTYPKGTNIHDGNECSGVILVRSGSLRLYIMSEDGRDITLYRLHKGDICMLSASCVLQAITFDVFVDAVSRLSDVMWVMQQILFMRMDKRLAIFLTDESARTNSDTIPLTHEQIARYIGSAREVVSRMLKYFANEGIVKVSRKGIKILDKKRLRQLAIQHGQNL